MLCKSHIDTFYVNQLPIHRPRKRLKSIIASNLKSKGIMIHVENNYHRIHTLKKYIKVKLFPHLLSKKKNTYAYCDKPNLLNFVEMYLKCIKTTVN